MPQPAFAASRQAREREARKACLSGDAKKGVEILADLFVDTKNPTYIFNQGRCFEQNRLYEDASARFEEYLRTPGARLSPDDRAAAEKHIADCREKLSKEREDSPLQPTPPVVEPTSEPTPQPASPEPAAELVAEPEPQPVAGHRRMGLVTAGIVTAAVGVGGVVTGLVFNLKSNSAVNDMETKLGVYSKSKTDSQQNYKTLAWVGYGVGAACAAAGAIMIAVGASKSSPSASTRVAFVPSVGRGQVGAMLRGGF